MLDKAQEYSTLIDLFTFYYRSDRAFEGKQKDLKSICQKLISLRRYDYYETTRQAVRTIHEDLYQRLGLPIAELSKYFDDQTNLEARNMIAYEKARKEDNKDLRIAMLETELGNIRRELIELRYDNLTLEEKYKRLNTGRRAIKIDTKEALAQIALLDLIGAAESFIIAEYDKALCIISGEDEIDLYLRG